MMAHKILAVVPLDGLRLHIYWQPHGEDWIDFSQLIVSHQVLSALQEDDLFMRAQVGEDGWSVFWDDPIELDAENLFRLARYQAGDSMEPEKFRVWRNRLGLGQDKAAHALGISKRMVHYYESGDYLIPKTVMLACKGYEAMRLSSLCNVLPVVSSAFSA